MHAFSVTLILYMFMMYLGHKTEKSHKRNFQMKKKIILDTMIYGDCNCVMLQVEKYYITDFYLVVYVICILRKFNILSLLMHGNIRRIHRQIYRYIIKDIFTSMNFFIRIFKYIQLSTRCIHLYLVLRNVRKFKFFVSHKKKFLL